MIYGYARCSTNESKQDISRQTRQLKEMGATDNTIYYEYQSGAKKDRIELNKLLDIVKAGDTICTTEISRISRSTKHLCELMELAKEKQIKIVIQNSITIDCTNGELDPMTNAFLQIGGVFAELERNMTIARIKDGKANKKATAKAEGREWKDGRKETTIDDLPNNFKRYYIQWKSGDFNKSELAKLTGLSRPSVNKYIKLLEV